MSRARSIRGRKNLLNYLSRPSVARFGVKIRGEAVVKGEHTLSDRGSRRREPGARIPYAVRERWQRGSLLRLDLRRGSRQRELRGADAGQSTCALSSGRRETGLKVQILFG